MVKLITGLGNPGTKYANSRHNLGFRAVDRLLDESPARTVRSCHSSLIFETEKFGLLCKPLTYMNRSGKALAGLSLEFGLKPQEILVIYDDFALDFGMIRVRAHGSAGSHNGLKSILESLGTQQVPRIRLGIRTEELSEDPEKNWHDFVLSDFRRSEKHVVEEMLDLCCDAVTVILEYGITTAMNRFNKKQKLVDR